MFYVYALFSKQNEDVYIGYCEDLRKRFSEHNSGLVKATKGYRPWKLVYYESYLSAKDARRRELRLKHHGKGWQELQQRLLESIYEAKKVRD